MIYAKVAGTGSALPKRVVSNEELAQTVDTSDEWIKQRTGIAQRYIAGEGETTSSLAVDAAKQAIDTAGLNASDIDLIIVATTTPDLVFPSTATIVQNELGCFGGPAFDVQAVCAGFVYAFATAEKFVKTGAAKNALVIGAETFTRILNWEDRTTCVLFGDGAGAVVLSASDEPGVLTTRLYADGRQKENLWVPSGVSTNYQAMQDGAAFVQMNGQEVFKFAVKALAQVVDDALEEAGMTAAEIDWLVPHQANIRIIQSTAKKLKMSMDNVVVTVDQHGNTSAASIPLALDTAVRDGRIQRGQTVLIEGIGGGFAWGGAIFRF
ncbi:MAG: ketoacyl-ACP synthase III [Gammaproteobacteria bacterium]|nr:ketoacyl-ACP synthase III [Gammaproteobacteria bacterium]